MIKTISRLCLALGVAAALGDAPAHAAAAATTVKIENFTFEPQTLTIHAGTTITWVNDDDKDHTVVADDGSFESDNLGNGDKFKFTFKKKGKFSYHCKYHPREKGVVIVTE